MVLIQSIWLPVVLLAAWEACSTLGWLNPYFFPPPSMVLATAWKMTAAGELPLELAATLSRYAQGVVLGCVSGIVCGVLMGTSVIARRALEPLIAALYSTPKLTLLPLLMLLLGIGNESRILLIALVGLIFLSMQTLDALRGVDPHYAEMARVYRADNWTVTMKAVAKVSPPKVTGLALMLRISP